MNRRYAVIVRTSGLWGFLAPPIVEERRYRWRWMARASAWFINNVPPLGIACIQRAEFVDGD